MPICLLSQCEEIGIRFISVLGFVIWRYDQNEKAVSWMYVNHKKLSTRTLRYICSHIRVLLFAAPLFNLLCGVGWIVMLNEKT